MAKISCLVRTVKAGRSSHIALQIRCFDVIASLLGLLLLWPLFLVVGLLIRRDSPGPVFYKGQRVGQGDRLFELFKFRTMVPGADHQGPAITLKVDSRITPFGRFLRRTKLDELPQLINVLRGEMSLVGPRPEDPRYVAQYTPDQRQVLSVRPGITSPASLRYRAEEALLSGEQWETVYLKHLLPNKVAMELSYLRRRTVWTDIAVVLQTLAVLGKGTALGESVLRLRNRHFFALDVLALLLIPAVALTMHLEGVSWWPEHARVVLLFTGVALTVKLPILYRMNLYNRYWRTAGISDLTVLVAAVGVSTVVLVLLVMIARAVSPAPGRPIVISLSVLLIDALLTATVMTGSRFGVHGLYAWNDQRQARIGGRRTLVVGAGDAGVMAVREMRSFPRLDMEPVAFADEDPLKINTLIEGVSVAGSCSDIPALVESHQIQRIIVAMPEASVHQQHKVIGLCRQTGVVTQALPGTYEILAGFKTISCLPQIDINHLLHRQPVSTDLVEVADHLRGATVLVTGAGGSIGSELCRQIARLGPVQIVLLGHGENSIAELALDLSLSFPDLFAPPVIADIRDRQRIAQVIDGFHPDVIFHAAAHKHVPLMETGVAEAVTNNLLGTRCVLQAAEQYGVKRLVLISTDKAVHPCNVMGATKRLCELLVVAAAQRSGHAYMAVRFGNVLGSRGSVIPIFQRQVAAGGPLTITHPDMRRYFMTIPEAVQLVLQAGVLGQGGEVFVLDMGEPVRILDLATDLVRLSGLEPERDIKIVFTGLRPGEKLDEELFLQTEQVGATKHQKIFVGTCDSSVRADVLDEMVASLIAMAQDETACHDEKRLRHQLLEACRWVDAHQSYPQVFGPKPASVDGSVPAVSIPAAHTRLPEPA